MKIMGQNGGSTDSRGTPQKKKKKSRVSLRSVRKLACSLDASINPVERQNIAVKNACNRINKVKQFTNHISAACPVVGKKQQRDIHTAR